MKAGRLLTWRASRRRTWTRGQALLFALILAFDVVLAVAILRGWSC